MNFIDDLKRLQKIHQLISNQILVRLTNSLIQFVFLGVNCITFFVN